MKISLLLVFCIPVFLFSQVQIGDDIVGDTTNDLFGLSLSLSNDGNIIAVGASGNDGGENNAGLTRIYQNNSGVWEQIGGDIYGERFSDGSGHSVSLSADGSIVAIGAPNNSDVLQEAGHVRVFQNTAGTWSQIGNDIDAEGAFDEFGWSVSLSADGSILAVGAPFNDGNSDNAGHVRVYENISGVWTQIGEDIDGDAEDDLFGYSVSVNAAGNIVAIGAPSHRGSNFNLAGQVKVYENISGTWTQLGSDIDGFFTDENYGYSVSLSADGSTIAGGAPTTTSGTSRNGTVRIYSINAGLWQQVGDDILGEALTDRFGFSVSISNDGNIVAAGATRNDGGAFNAGHARVFQNIGGSWTKIGEDIDGESTNDNKGWSVDIASNAMILAVGAPFANNSDGGAAGKSEVFDISSEILSINDYSSDEVTVYPNPTQGRINIRTADISVFEKATVYNHLGQVVLTSVFKNLDTSNLNSGIYLLLIETSNSKQTIKFIVK